MFDLKSLSFLMIVKIKNTQFKKMLFKNRSQSNTIRSVSCDFLHFFRNAKAIRLLSFIVLYRLCNFNSFSVLFFIIPLYLYVSRSKFFSVLKYTTQVHTEKYILHLNKYYLFQVFHKFIYTQIYHKF